MGGYVYLICDPSQEAYKIGVTRDITQKRLKKLQCGNATELHIVSYVETDYPFRLETMLHAKYKPKKLLNEWFKLDPEDVINFNNTCETLKNTINILLDNPFFAKNIK